MDSKSRELDEEPRLKFYRPSRTGHSCFVDTETTETEKRSKSSVGEKINVRPLAFFFYFLPVAEIVSPFSKATGDRVVDAFKQ